MLLCPLVFSNCRGINRTTHGPVPPYGIIISVFLKKGHWNAELIHKWYWNFMLNTIFYPLLFFLNFIFTFYPLLKSVPNSHYCGQELAAAFISPSCLGVWIQLVFLSCVLFIYVSARTVFLSSTFWFRKKRAGKRCELPF